MKNYRENSQRVLPFENFLLLYIDGASRGNPGHAGVGIVIKGPDEQTIAEVSKYIGVTTNNRAEYTALIEGIEAIARLKIEEPRFKISGLRIFSDSELLVKQINGQYKVRENNLKSFYERVSFLLKEFKSRTGFGIEIRHIPREDNKEADRLANMAIDSTSHKQNPK